MYRMIRIIGLYILKFHNVPELKRKINVTIH